ncbi:MAG: 16S rRNA (guanine(966)-N(2))-methyltransferase RsmD [Leptothrix sp. (in: b-proteobacteria)]
MTRFVPPSTPTPKRATPQEVRLIGGLWRRSKLPVLDRPGLRPTPDRVRETLYNWLGQDLGGWRVLDAFAGSGALGFEAGSRGAAQVVLLESDAQIAASLRASQQRLAAQQIEVHQADALAWMRQAAAGSFDLVLLDPPYAADLFDQALTVARPLIGGEGYIYLEADRAYTDAQLQAFNLRLRRAGRAGTVHFHLLEPLRSESFLPAAPLV